MRSALVVALLGLPAVAHAHIHLLQPLSRTDNTQGDPQKNQHCGTLQPGRTARVTTFKPGQEITVRWAETINHSGWYRVAFQQNGEVFRIPPASNGPAGGGAASNFPTENYTGMTDPANGSIVLRDRIADGMLMTTVTLPMVQCTNCTLQLIQVMNDAVGYAPADDIYFNCADIVLAADAPDAGVQPMVDAGVNAGDDDASISMNTGTVSGGCSTGGATGLPAALALVGFAGLRRRRSR